MRALDAMAAESLLCVVTCKNWSAPYLFAFADGTATSIMVKARGGWKKCARIEYDEDTLRSMADRLELPDADTLACLHAVGCTEGEIEGVMG